MFSGYKVYFTNLEFRFSSLFLPYRYQVVTSRLQLVEETGVPGENHGLTPSHWQLSHMSWVGFKLVQ